MKLISEASLIVPLYNNEQTIIQELIECQKILKKICQKYEIIVCDDKSTDSSAIILKKTFSKDKNFKLLFNIKNLGIAGNIRKLYKAAKYEYVVLFSADGEWNPKDIERMLRYIKSSNADIVIGKRSKEVYSMYRKIISFFYNFLPIIFFNVHTEDAGSIKVIKKEVLDETPVISTSVFSEAEIIIRAKKNGKIILSIPISFKSKIGKKSGGKISLAMKSLIDLFYLRLKI